MSEIIERTENAMMSESYLQ